MLDKKQYPDIICANESDYQKGAAPYYTNSTQLPVNYTDDIFETLILQDKLQTKYTGGTVLHIFLGEQVEDIEVIKGLIRKIANNFHLPYFTISPTFSICPSHGYLNGNKEKCDRCSQETEVYSRVVGYLRPVRQWNDGKQAEFKMRHTFKISDAVIDESRIDRPADQGPVDNREARSEIRINQEGPAVIQTLCS
jgi:ribonucleoside-triphosphate reductase